MGVTNRLRPKDETTIGKVTPDPEDVPDELGLADIDHFSLFVRGTKVPPRDTALAATPGQAALHAPLATADRNPARCCRSADAKRHAPMNRLRVIPGTGGRYCSGTRTLLPTKKCARPSAETIATRWHNPVLLE